MCSTAWSYSSLEQSDYVVFRLEQCCDYVATMVNNALTDSPHAEVSRLVELRSIISQLLMMWEAAFSLAIIKDTSLAFIKSMHCS